MTKELTGMYEVFEAVENAIRGSTPELRDSLRKALAGYQEDFPGEYFWATGPQAPVMLHHLMLACTPCDCDVVKVQKLKPASPVQH